MAAAPVELINLRLTARGATPKPAQPRHPPSSRAATYAQAGTRPAYFEGAFKDVAVYDGFKLEPENEVTAPAIVVQPTTTIVVPPDFDLVCDEYMNYLMYRQGADLARLCATLRSER